MNYHNFFRHRFFHYFISFRFGEFPSVLRSVIDNKQINFNCFFKILPSRHECHLSLYQSNYTLFFCSNISNEITKVNRIQLRRKFNKLSQGTPFLKTVTTDSFCDTENWPLYPPRSRGCLVISQPTKLCCESIAHLNCTTQTEINLYSQDLYLQFYLELR